MALKHILVLTLIGSISNCASEFTLDASLKVNSKGIGQGHILSDTIKTSGDVPGHKRMPLAKESSVSSQTIGDGDSGETQVLEFTNGSTKCNDNCTKGILIKHIKTRTIRTDSLDVVANRNSSSGMTTVVKDTPFFLRRSVTSRSFPKLHYRLAVSYRNISSALVTRVSNGAPFSFNKRSLTFRSVLNDDTNLQGTRPVSWNQKSGVTNELTNKEILDESRRWHIGPLQLYGIKRSKQAPTPPGGITATTVALSVRRRHGLRSTDFNTFHNKQYANRHDHFDRGPRINRAKRDTEAGANSIVPGHIKRLPNSEEVYKLLKTLDVEFYMPLNMSMNATDSNATSDGLEKCMALLGELYVDAEDDGKMYCNSSWDEVSCWPMTLAGTLASVPCPGYLTGISDSNNATKFCYENGTWADKAVYDFCLGTTDIKAKPDNEHGPAIRIIYNVGFTVSTLTLAIALFILLYFRSLRCLRNLIHCHLIVTFIDTNIIWIITRHSLLYIQNPSLAWLCKTLISLYRFSHATNFFWMFVEGLYLHIIVVWTYSADKIKLRYLVGIGWGLPVINLIIWIILRIEFADDHCWLPFHDISEYDFAMIGPILLVLLANIIFLGTIVWVLITKLRASHTLETRQYRVIMLAIQVLAMVHQHIFKVWRMKAVRATIILFPLLGITYVLFIMPPSDHPQVKIVFRYINAFLQSFQGLLVAIFYCFLNGEVKTVLKKRLSRYTDARNFSTKYTKSSVIGYYGNSTVYGNGAVDSKRRLNGSCGEQPPESIPLTDTKPAEEEMIES